MTDADYILADLIIKKMPVNQPFNLTVFCSNILEGESLENYNPETLQQLSNAALKNSSAARAFLLEKGYLKVCDASIPKDISTESGQKAQELGGLKQYLDYLKKQNRKNFLIEFPKRYWYIVAIGGFLVGKSWDYVFSDISTIQTKNELQDTSRQDKTIQALRDSVQVLLRQPKETLYIQKNPLIQLPKDTSKDSTK